MRILNYIAILTIGFLTTQCAKQTAPTGGPKDEEPPALVKSTPPNQQVNFKEKQIELLFDEPVQLNNPREQLIITPSIGALGKDYEIVAKKNKVILTFKSKLADSTTYSINFRESIADLNEKNTTPLKVAISTGTYIDSLSIKGNVIDVLTSELVKNYTVAVVPQSDTFDIFKHNALFFTYVDKEGNYAIENLKEGSYILYAFDDKNKNLRVDSRSEAYGFLAETIQLNKSAENKTLNTFKLDAGIMKLISARPMFGAYNIKTSKSIVTFTLEPTDKNQLIIAQQDKDLSNIKVYNTLQNIDSLLTKFSASDSLENKIDTVLYIKFSKTENTNKDKFQISAEELNYITETKTLTATLNFSKPVINAISDSLYINVDSVTKINFLEKDLQWNYNRTRVAIKKIIEELAKTAQPRTSKTARVEQKATDEKKYKKLILSKGAFISVELDTIQKTEIDIKFIKPEDVGIISYNISTKENFIVQLLTKDNKIIAENKNISESKFLNIPPGTYFLRLIIDKNNNGKWDPGNFKTRKEPEEILFYKNSKDQLEINIKANWEVGPLLITY
jgi:uncharacterized protein (DUF2141 family)